MHSIVEVFVDFMRRTLSLEIVRGDGKLGVSLVQGYHVGILVIRCALHVFE